jgi:hypothetical protein
MDIFLEKDTTTYIQEILGWFYKPESILSKNVQILWDWKMEVSFIFPEYLRTINPLEHVSANQINEAVMEGSYLIIGWAIKRALFNDISFDDFLQNRAIALYRSLDIKYKKQVKSWVICSLTFSLWEVKNVKWKFSTIEVQFAGFAEWTSKSCLAINEYINTITE